MSCQHEDQWMLYAADALDAAERDGLEAHLQRPCVACRQALVEAEEMLGQLPLALEPVPASAKVRSEIVGRIQERRGSADARSGEPVRLPPPRRGGRWWGRIAAALVGAGLVGLVAAPLVMESHQRLSQLETRMASVGLEPRDASWVERLQGMFDASADLLVTLRSSALEVIYLSGVGDVDEQSRARLLWDRDRGVCYFIAGEEEGGLTFGEEESGRFRVWIERDDGSFVDAGSFEMDRTQATARFSTAKLDDVDHISNVAISRHQDFENDDDPKPTGRLFSGHWPRAR